MNFSLNYINFSVIHIICMKLGLNKKLKENQIMTKIVTIQIPRLAR
jgi:hypothetical protein